MRIFGLSIFLVLLLSCPLLAQEETYDPIFDNPVFMDPGFDLGQVASALNYQRYGPNDCGSEAEGYWPLDSDNYRNGQYGPLGYGTESEGDNAPLTLPWPYGLY